jgi:transposase-like protein
MTPEEYAEYASLVADVVDAALHATASDQECLVAMMHLCGAERDVDIARALGVTRQRAQQVRKKALRHMVAYLRHQGYEVSINNFSFRAGTSRRPRNAGERNANAKLTAEWVREARRLARQGVSISELARRYGVSAACMRSAVVGETWAHVE